MNYSSKREKLRVYHAQLDLLNAMMHPDQSDLEWQIEDIETWTVRKIKDVNQIFLKVIWIGRNKQWLSMDDLRVHDPFLLTRYAHKHGLTNTSGWKWTKAFLEAESDFDQMVQAYKVSRYMKTFKFGVEVPQSTKQALEIDKRDGNKLWKEAMITEIDQLHAHKTFIVLEEHQPIPPGYKRIPYHCIYDVKFDGRRKCRLVAGGHMTDPSMEDIFSGVVSMETVRICFTLA